MAQPRSQKLETAKFSKSPCGLVWIETTDRDMFPDGELSANYTTWLLVDPATDRMIVSIDEPYPDKLCYCAASETGQQRKFISLEGAKRWAIAASMEIINQERAIRASDRKCRRVQRIHRSR